MEVGFWRRYEDKQLDPQDLRPWPEQTPCLNPNLDILIEYLSIGTIESFEYGYATCRLCGLYCDEMGCCSLTDGKYVWPEGLSHYLTHHNIILPQEFIDYALTNISTQRIKYKNRIMTREEQSLFEWREENKLIDQSNHIESLGMFERLKLFCCS